MSRSRYLPLAIVLLAAAPGARLARPPRAPLSEMARIGRALFFDARLSRSGRMSCASCHSPAHAYGPPPQPPARGFRAIPSLRYLDRIPTFSVGPDNEALEGAAGSAAGAMVPRGGLFWDGRATTLQHQAMGPLFNPQEMANTDTASLAARIRRYYGRQLAGLSATGDARLLLDEATYAIVRFELEDPSFHPYSSKYDAWLEGRARLTDAEARGLALFEDSTRGNCAGCHLDRPGPHNEPPAFSDYQYEALGAPRNLALAANRDSGFHDLGLCGPDRSDEGKQYCGMFRTPSLRNAALRTDFFHNGVFHTLDDVVAFYSHRDATPDLPSAYRGNLDTTRAAHFSPRETSDLIAFLRTLTDGYEPGR